MDGAPPAGRNREGSLTSLFLKSQALPYRKPRGSADLVCPQAGDLGPGGCIIYFYIYKVYRGGWAGQDYSLDSG